MTKIQKNKILACHPTREFYAKDKCFPCYQTAWRKSHEYANKRARGYIINWDLRKRYGITIEEREQLRKHQNYKCAICFKERKLYIDHKHRTKKVRGLLCPRCNTLCGYLENDNGEIQKAKEYLSAYEKRNKTDFDDRPTC